MSKTTGFILAGLWGLLMGFLVKGLLGLFLAFIGGFLISTLINGGSK